LWGLEAPWTGRSWYCCTIITADAVGYQLWPKEMVQDAYFVDGEADMNKLMGTVVRHPITAGEPVTQGSLVYPGDRGFLAAALGPGMRAVTVPVSEKTGVGGFIFPGDHVDLMLTQTVAGDGGGLKATETILQNLRVLATDQRTDSTSDENGKTVVKSFRTVTFEATPKVAEKIEVAQTIGTLSLALRSLADDQADLDKALAQTDVNVPNNLSQADENKLLRQVSTIPQAGSDYVTGGDVSRFQRKTLPPPTPPAGQQAGPGMRAVQVPTGPMVRVTRGHAVSQEQIGGAVSGMVGAQAAGVNNAAGAVSRGTTAGLIAG
jgi:pilus assembly protein CpaB